MVDGRPYMRYLCEDLHGRKTLGCGALDLRLVIAASLSLSCFLSVAHCWWCFGCDLALEDMHCILATV